MQIGYDLADNQIDTLTKAFQATTVACARCHDHKLDAVSMQGLLRPARHHAQLAAGQPHDRRSRGECRDHRTMRHLKTESAGGTRGLLGSRGPADRALPGGGRRPGSPTAAMPLSLLGDSMRTRLAAGSAALSVDEIAP